jgi:hypothetical protein
LQKAQINGTYEHHALTCVEIRRNTMTKSKLFLIAAVAAVTLASPAFAQSTVQSTRQERTLRSDQAQVPPGSNLYDGNQGDPQGGSYPGDN